MLEEFSVGDVVADFMGFFLRGVVALDIVCAQFVDMRLTALKFFNPRTSFNYAGVRLTGSVLCAFCEDVPAVVQLFIVWAW
jgi:hypothetical protein